MKRKQLEWALQNLATFSKPNLALEQYVTGTELAATILQTIAVEHDGLEGRLVADLGCGCGTLMIGAALLDAGCCIGFEIDPSALAICAQNVAVAKVGDKTEMVQCDVVGQLLGGEGCSKWSSTFDTVIMNPPFGTKNNRGADVKFLEVAVNITAPEGSIYSLHKTSTRDFVVRKARELDLQAVPLAQLRYDLPATYSFHKKKSLDIEVDFIQFQKVPGR